MQEKKENYLLSQKQIILLKLVIIISCPVLTLILSNRFNIVDSLVGSILSQIIIIYIMLKTDINIINKKNAILAALIGCYAMKYFMYFYRNGVWVFSQSYGIDKNITNAFLGILALPTLIFFFYKFIEFIIPKVKKFFINLTIVEKKYLKIIFIVSMLLSIFTIFTTTAFTKPNTIDVIYTSDSGDLLYTDVYFNVSHTENDIRQPLFGFFALPFSILAKIISEFLFFLPGNYEYETVMTVFQFLLTTITTILIARLMKLEEKDKPYLYFMFSFSFPYLIFNMVLEQYVISLFYLILTIYCFANYEGVNYAYIGATGALITSGILFPLITKFKSVKKYFKDILKCLFIFVAIFIIIGQFPQVLTFGKRIKFLTRFSEPLPFQEKAYQFFYFVKAIFFACEGEIIGYTYQLTNVENIISIIGLIMFIIVIFSGIINRKEYMAKISLFWVIFSTIILLIIGWGTTENGLILYTLYFAWAYLCLYYLLLKKIFKNRKLFISFIVISIVIMAIMGLKEFLNIIIFAVRYY